MLKAIAVLTLVLILLTGITVFAGAAPVMHEPGWTIAPFVTLPSTRAEDPEVDGAGNLYVACGQDGVFRVTPTGSMSLWSSAQGYGLAMLPAGEAYLPSRNLPSTNCIWGIHPDGTYSPLVSGPSPSWLYCTLTPSGLLYGDANGPMTGIYLIDRATGAFSQVLAAGPGPGGAGTYTDMATTSDNALYVSGWLAPGSGIFRVMGGVSTQVIPLSVGLFGLCTGPSDTLFGAGYTGSSSTTDGQVWRLDVTTGTESLFASGFGATVGVCYDPVPGRFYVVDFPGSVWTITRSSTPTLTTSWGSIKTKYK